MAGVKSWPSERVSIRFSKLSRVRRPPMRASMFNVRVPLDGSESGGDVFLMNTFTDAQLIVSRDVADLMDRIREDHVPQTGEEREALATLTEHGFIVGDREGE